MTRAANYLSACGALAWLLLLTSAVSGQTAATPPLITAVSAQLYYEETGAFSRNVLQGTFPLWNTIIGEGDAEHASHATLVTVEVRGRNVPLGAVRIAITATDSNGRLLGRRETEVDLYGDKTRFYAPLFLNDTGCDEVTISAWLVGKGVSTARTTRKIPFRCGE